MTSNCIISRVSKSEMTSRPHAYCCSKLNAFNNNLAILSCQPHGLSGAVIIYNSLGFILACCYSDDKEYVRCTF